MMYRNCWSAIFFSKTFDYPEEDPVVPLGLRLGQLEVAALVVAAALGPLEHPEPEVEPAGERHGREVAPEARQQTGIHLKIEHQNQNFGGFIYMMGQKIKIGLDLNQKNKL